MKYFEVAGPAIVPPVVVKASLTMVSCTEVPPTVQPLLTAGTGKAICSEWATVNTSE